MKCLSCNEEMINHFVQTKNQQIAYDVCEACGSLWLDKGELDKIAFQVDGDIEFCSTEATAATKERTKKCPRCDRKNLDKVGFLGCDQITLDRCSRCGGYWLDGGELNLINRDLEKIMPVHGKGFSDFVNNVHVPYWHKRIRRRSHQTDFKIEVLPIKGSTFVSDTNFDCPACHSRLAVYKVFGIGFEGCPRCRGVFLDKDELRKLKDKAENESWEDLRWMDDEIEAIEKANVTVSRRTCPKCEGERLLTTNFDDSTTLIDYCSKCHGIWLDEDEFQEIVKDLISKLNASSTDKMARKTYEEIKEIWSGPENIISEILDAKAAVWALINTTIFEHPRLSKAMVRFGDAAGRVGMN